MKMIIPSQIKKRIIRKTMIRLTAFVGLLLLITAAFLFWSPLAQLERNNQVFTFYMGVLVVMAITGVPFKLVGKSWQGEVLAVKEKTGTESWMPSKPTMSTWYTANTHILTLKTPKGDIIEKKAEQTQAQRMTTGFVQYEKGDYAARIHGGEYPAHYKTASNETRCIVCGKYSSNDLHECDLCGNALVTFQK